MPPTASEETDCREVSGYTSGPAPDTCTVQLTLNDTEADIVGSLKDKYQELPLRCRAGKNILQHKTGFTARSVRVQSAYIVRYMMWQGVCGSVCHIGLVLLLRHQAGCEIL